MKYFLGVDAGGSKTSCLICDQEARPRGLGIGGPANYKLVGEKRACQSINEAIERALHRAGIQREEIAAAFYAVSGYDLESDIEVIEEFISRVNPASQMEIDNDALASLHLGSSDGIGVALICGTGSNCIGINHNKERLQIGGLGREFGDYAGGREIAIQGMAAAVRAYDGRGTPSILHDYFIEELGLQKLIDFEPVLHNEKRGYPLARLAPLVFKAAEAGDQVAADIIRFNGKELALSANVAISRLFEKDDKVEVILTGGIFKSKSELLLESINSGIKEKHPGALIKMLEGDPVIGAAIKALRGTGIVVNEKLKERIIGGYLELAKSGGGKE